MANKEVDHFTSIPWCATLLNDPSIVIIDNSVRAADLARLSESSALFLTKTLATEDTIRADLIFYRLPLTDGRFPAHTMCSLYDVGEGVSSWKGTAHGGFTATLLDETSGRLLLLNAYLNSKSGALIKNAWKTASIKVAYKRPVPVGKVVLVTVTAQPA